jgi:hypothetical protein
LCKKELIARGWTLTAIDRVLGEPDRRLAVRAVKHAVRKDRPECRYDIARVLAAEAAGNTRIRKKRRSEDAADFARCVNPALSMIKSYVNEPKNANWCDDPTTAYNPFDSETWMPDFRRYARKFYRIRYPWWIEKMVFMHTRIDRKIHLYVGHKEGVRWPCPKCRRACRVYDHCRETVWPKRGPAILHGRLPRIRCKPHGVVRIRPLAAFVREGALWDAPPDAEILEVWEDPLDVEALQQAGLQGGEKVGEVYVLHV